MDLAISFVLLNPIFLVGLTMVYVLVSRRRAKIHLFVDHLASLASRALPLQTGLRMIAQDVGGIFGGRLNRVARRLEEGASLEQAMEAAPRAFPPVVRSMIAMGERSGNLAGFLEELRRSYRLLAEQPYSSAYAFLYPLIVSVVINAAILGLRLGIEPKMQMVLSQLGSIPSGRHEWDWISFASEGILVLCLAAMAAVMLGGFSAHFRAPAFPFLKGLTDRLALLLPVVGTILRNGSLQSFALNCGLALRAGARLPEAASAAAQIEPNLLCRRRLESVARSLDEGATLSEAGRDAGRFPEDLLWFITAGERAGTLGDHLVQAASHLDTKQQLVSTLASRAIIPAFILLNGGVVLATSLLVFQPAWGALRQVMR